MKSNFKNQKLPAFSLMEILIALAIIGIITMMAVINYQPVISKTKSLEAQNQLAHLYNLEKSYFYVHSKYSKDPMEVGFEQGKLVSEDGNANYIIEIINADHTGFLAKATAVVDFDGDGVFNVWEVDEQKNIKEVSPD